MDFSGFTFSHWLAVTCMAIAPHAFSLLFYLRNKPSRSKAIHKVYDIPVPRPQVMREFWSSLISPMHAALLTLLVAGGLIRCAEFSIWGFMGTLVSTFVWTEIWHYFTHRAMHTRSLLFLHRFHHSSMVLGPFSAMSFSILEKAIFSLGVMGFMGIVSFSFPVEFFGLVAYYMLYFYTNQIGHSNLEGRSESYTDTWKGRYFGSATGFLSLFRTTIS